MKAQGFLEREKVTMSRQVDASRNRVGADEALALARAAKKVIAARGAKIVTFDMTRRPPPGDEELLAVLLGPTGNLRAPTLRVGTTLLVGYAEGAYAEALGAR